MSYTIVDSPIGPLTLVEVDGALAGLFMEGHQPAPRPATLGGRRDGILPEVVEQLSQYFALERTSFDLCLKARGTDFQQQVWGVLRTIPYGRTMTYGQVAEALGRPGAARAVGLANGRNPISIVVPCHRVVGSSGTLTGYAGGVARKAFLLDLESRQTPTPPAAQPTLPDRP